MMKVCLNGLELRRSKKNRSKNKAGILVLGKAMDCIEKNQRYCLSDKRRDP